MEKVIKSPSSTFGSDVIKLMTGTVGAQLFGLAMLPVLTRLYSPAAFGTLALFLALAGIPAVVACGRYELAILLPRTDREARAVLDLCLFLPVLTAGLVAAWLWQWSSQIEIALNSGSLRAIYWMMPPYVLVTGWFLALNYWLTREKRYGTISVARVVNSIATNTFKLLGSVVGLASGAGLALGTLVGQALATAQLGFFSWRRAEGHDRIMGKVSEAIQMLVRYRRFPLVDAWGALLNCVSWQLPILMLAVYFPETIVGLFALAWRTLQLPMSILGTALAQVFFQRAAELRQDPTRLASVSLTVFRRLCSLALVPALVLAGFGGDLFAILFGDDFRSAGAYAQILSFWMFWWFISSPLSNIFSVLERQDLSLGVHIVVFVTRLVGLLIGCAAGDLKLALWLLSLGGIIVYGGLTFWILELTGAGWRSGCRALLVEMVRAAPALIALGGVKVAFSNSLAQSVCALGIVGLYLVWTVRKDEAILRQMPWLAWNIRSERKRSP